MTHKSSSKRAGDELEQEKSKKQKIDDDEADMKKHMEIVPNNKVAINAIPLATKPPIIVDWKIIKEGKMGYFQIIKDDGSSRRYSSTIKMLQNIDREDLETLWKLVKAKHGNTRPEEAYEIVLWGDLKVMFEPDVESKVWRNLQGHKVTVWKLFSSSGVHFVRFQNLHIFMLLIQKLLLKQEVYGLLSSFLLQYFSYKENEVYQDMQLIQKLRDDQKCMKKVEHSSRSKATEDIISIGSFVKVLVLNQYVIVRYEWLIRTLVYVVEPVVRYSSWCLCHGAGHFNDGINACDLRDIEIERLQQQTMSSFLLADLIKDITMGNSMMIHYEWLSTCERIFDLKEISDHLKVKMVAVRLRKHTSLWWDHVKKQRKNEGKSKIVTWEKMKKLMKHVKNKKGGGEFYNSVIRDKVEIKGKNVVGAFMNVPILVGNFAIITHFIVVENMDGYRDQDMGDIILGEPFCKASCVEAKRFDGLIHYPQWGVLNLGPEYVRDAKIEEWLTRRHISVHEME
ncbi:hypothetical protein Tco_0706497 [Tanacetum coccineum]|uniref:Uncharacterized protein n=1 Tax=Tanacetum coccineum TaxID=301880 RepID=A0ABQ4Y8I5_9ASTR